MAYYTESELTAIGFKKLGKKAKVSRSASIYTPELIEIGDFSRIDDFSILSGRIQIGRYNHITPMCLIAGGEPGVFLSDFCTLAYGVKVFSQSDDYSGMSMTNSLIPKKYKHEILKRVTILDHSIVGAGSIIMPGVTLGEGTAVGAMSLVLRDTAPWGIYYGQPAKRKKDREKELLNLKTKFLSEQNDDPV